MLSCLLSLCLVGPIVSQSAVDPSVTSVPSVGHVDLNIPLRRDISFDMNGILYITAGGKIERFDTQTGTSLAPLSIGGNLYGIDLSPDGSTLAVADRTPQAGYNFIHLVDTATGVAETVRFPLAFYEGGTYMVAWALDGRILVTSTFNGSGWVPLRRHDPTSGVTETIGSVRQNTMLTPNADRSRIALAESNISSGPVHVYHTNLGAIVASDNNGWFMFEVAISANGRYVVAPSYKGAFVYVHSGSQLVDLGTIGQYASWGPIGAVFSPGHDVLYTAEWGSQHGVKAYSLPSMQLLETLDPYPFPWGGNGALGNGRMEVSPDGRWLAVTIADAVRVYRL